MEITEVGGKGDPLFSKTVTGLTGVTELLDALANTNKESQKVFTNLVNEQEIAHKNNTKVKMPKKGSDSEDEDDKQSDD